MKKSIFHTLQTVIAEHYWLVLSALVGLAGLFVTHHYTANWSVACVVGLAVFGLIMYFHPKRRFFRFAVGLVALVSVLEMLPNISYSYTLWEMTLSSTGQPMPLAVKVVLLLLAGLLFVLDFLMHTISHESPQKTGNKPQGNAIATGDIQQGNISVVGDHATVNQSVTISINEAAIEQSTRVIELRQQITDLRDYKTLAQKDLAHRDAEIERLTTELEKTETAWRDAIQRLQQQNLDEQPEAYQQAAKAFAEGDMDATLALLNEAYFSQQKQTHLEKQQATQAHDNALFNSYLLRAEALTVNGRYPQAETVYQELSDVFPNNPKAHFELAKFFQVVVLKDQAAETAYRRALELHAVILQPDLVAMSCIQNNLATLLDVNGKPDEAERLYRNALATRKQLAADNPTRHLEFFVSTQNNLAVLLDNNNKPTEAEELYREALASYEELAKKKRGRYLNSLASIQNNLAKLLKIVASQLKQRSFTEKHWLVMKNQQRKTAGTTLNLSQTHKTTWRICLKLMVSQSRRRRCSARH